MFTLYQSNNLRLLKYKFLKIIKKKKFSFIKDTYILIPDNNISFILKMFLSKKLGVCANLNFILTGKFIWKIYKYLIPEISNNYLNKKNNLILVILHLLPKCIKLKEFNILKEYLNNDYNYNKLFNLSVKISNIYDEYLMYRVDWLKKWQTYKVVNDIKDNIHYNWQSILWRKINKYFIKKFNYKWNRSFIYYEVLKRINNKNLDYLKKIKNILIFNVVNIPPIYLNILYRLSKFININYFLINPSYEYWYDINLFNFSDNNLYTKNKLYKFYNYNKLNSFLLNCGKNFSQYLSLFFDMEINEKKYFLNFKKKSKNIDIIKNDILKFKNSFFIKKKINDNSVIINNYCGYVEEINNLKFFLLDLILNKSYSVNDIIVYVTDINIYYPYIKGIFLDELYKKYLPFKILENNYLYDNNVLNIFSKLLNIYNVEYNFCDLLNFLKYKIIFKKFNISYDELNIIFYIIKDIGINLNNKEILNNISYKEFNYSTWINGVKRILLGYCINNEFCIWNNIVPYSFLSNNFFNNFIEKICIFFFKIFYWRDVLDKSYNFGNWIFLLNNFLKDFFYKKYLDKNVFLNKKSILKLTNYNIFFLKKNKYNIEYFKKIFFYFLKYKKNKIFSINKINFCSFSCLKSISYKVTCLIGMNNDVFPKKNDNCSLNLINFNNRLGDHDRNSFDKYSFLEKIYFSKKKIYISYINFNYIKNSLSFPSSLLFFLNNYINKFNFNYIINFKKNNFFILIKIRKENSKYTLKNFFYFNKNKLLKINKGRYLINLLDLHNFWSYPIKFFFNKIFNINYFIENYHFNNEELFNIDNIKYYFLKFKIIDYLIKFNDLSNIYNYLQKSNVLPFNFRSKIIWEKEKNNILFLTNNIKKIYFKNNRIKINLKINNFVIKGFINKYKDNGLFVWFPRNLTIIDALLFWIDHLIYCYLGGKCCSYMYGYNGIWYFYPLSKLNSKFYLIDYVNGYLNNFNNPILLFPKSSNIWIFSAYNYITKNLVNKFYLSIAKKKLYYSLYGNNYIKGEISNIYILYILKKYFNFLNFDYIIKQIDIWLLPIFNNLIINYNNKK